MKFFSVMLAMLMTGTVSLCAAETKVYESKIEKKDLSGWMDLKRRTPPGADHAKLVLEDGKYIMKTSNHRWAGLSGTFSSPVKVYQNLKKLTLHIRLKKAGKGHYGSVLAISTRKEIDIHNGKAFSANRDSGIMIQGHIHHSACIITARLEGKNVKTIKLSNHKRPPFFSAHNKWADWHVTYDNEKKEVSITIDNNTEPSLVLRDIDFNGKTFNCFWISQLENAVASVNVVAETK